MSNPKPDIVARLRDWAYTICTVNSHVPPSSKAQMAKDAAAEIERLRAELAAAIKERDALRKRVAELEALSKPVYISHGQRVESIDLRERLVCAALTGLCADPRHDVTESVAVAIADRTLAAMRKEEGA